MKTKLEMKKGKVLASLADGDVDKEDIKDIIFDIFSSRNKFTFHFFERCFIYFVKLEPLFRCFKCLCAKRIRRSIKMFDKAEGKYTEKLDILNVMGVVNNSGNFLKSFLTREQKILLKFDADNIISADDSGDCCGGDSGGEQSIDEDDRMIANLSHKNSLCSMFTLAKLTNVLDPFTRRKLSEFEVKLFKNFYNKDGGVDTN